MALAASVSGFIVSDGSEDTVSSRCTSAEGKAVHPVLSKFQPNLPLCTPPSGVRFLWYSHWRQSSKQPVSCSLGFPPLYDSRFAHIGEHFHCGRIVMVKEQTLSFIQSARKGDFSGAKVNKKVSLTKNWRKNIGYSIFLRAGWSASQGRTRCPRRRKAVRYGRSPPCRPPTCSAVRGCR